MRERTTSFRLGRHSTQAMLVTDHRNLTRVLNLPASHHSASSAITSDTTTPGQTNDIP